MLHLSTEMYNKEQFLKVYRQNFSWNIRQHFSWNMPKNG